MDPNSQIELELVPMASDENLNNIQDDVNANFKPVRTSRPYSLRATQRRMALKGSLFSMIF